ncbi:hypothetical protein Nepgr_021812 [Nepenthes gracilis]|uniref:Uncharacterized protein n=1 Tax=Nepenthes gracilis TaxID=150966 RepID=A0AAD3T1I4_NEPGR|nr:hypothetical protein Nepgr_021812 [Nepenthes gracilis]
MGQAPCPCQHRLEAGATSSGPCSRNKETESGKGFSRGASRAGSEERTATIDNTVMGRMVQHDSMPVSPTPAHGASARGQRQYTETEQQRLGRHTAVS